MGGVKLDNPNTAPHRRRTHQQPVQAATQVNDDLAVLRAILAKNGFVAAANNLKPQDIRNIQLQSGRGTTILNAWTVTATAQCQVP